MSLKAYLPAIDTASISLTPDVGGPPYVLYAQVVGGVFENGSRMMYPGDSDQMALLTAVALIGATTTVASIRSALQQYFSDQFNLIFSRTDGNTIQFVWLDDKGIL